MPRRRDLNADIRVAMVIQGFHPRVGGAERQLLAVAPRLQERGVRVAVVTRRYPGLARSEVVAGVRVHRVGGRGPKPVASATFTSEAARTLRKLRPDVIHAHELLSPATAAVLAGAASGTPVVAKVLVSGELDHLRDERPFGRARLALFRRRIRAFLVISAAIDEELERAGVPARQRRFIPNGVDTERFAPASDADRALARRTLGVAEGPVGVYVGRLEAQKNLHQLVEVWDRVRATHPGAQLLVAGQGSQEEELRSRAGAGVRLLGPVTDVATLLAAADVFVLPSWREGLSNSLLEAMACGVPVVASAVGGTTEVVVQGGSGLLVDPGDAMALERALCEVLADGGLRSRLGQQARATIVHGHSLDARVDELHQLYREVIR